MDPLSGEIEKIPVLNVGKLKHKKNAQFNSSSINVVMKGHLVFEITYNAKTLKEEVLGIFNDKAFLTRIKLK